MALALNLSVSFERAEGDDGAGVLILGGVRCTGLPGVRGTEVDEDDRPILLLPRVWGSEKGLSSQQGTPCLRAQIFLAMASTSTLHSSTGF